MTMMESILKGNVYGSLQGASVCQASEYNTLVQLFKTYINQVQILAEEVQKKVQINESVQ